MLVLSVTNNLPCKYLLKNTLNPNIKIHIKYDCKQCDKQFTHLSALKRHLKSNQ